MNREKKQLAVVGVLVVLILGVGAFQFMRGSSDTPPPAAEKKTDKKATDEQNKVAAGPKNPGFPDLLAKDPFEPSTFIAEGTPAAVKTTPTPTPPAGVRTGSHRPPNFDFEGLGPLSNPNTSIETAGKGKSIPPLEPTKPVFGYQLVGIVDGAYPAAVFEDGSGNQQLVEVGQSIGPSATITSISRGKVRVKFNAETLVFNVGGNPHAK